ncbi:cytochrome o ubiquinol oxidase subunit IV [Acidisoma silvae]|uniref:Cytochrome bo(3) ubiquinol oxidase subunit 4 n=1 Tax=Acidisoma silvae TaxID=2802396 RepID=A0A963YUM4_9PROT|nr:cytochrome o ubiquinol oxidase subunit IV [Acidisoma silvae]MCB8876710.1 cytochrome o ubiquinol oxidase subunit IV [Acidisoma silvae]
MDHSAHGHSHVDAAGASHGSYTSYAIGFVLSVILTAAAFWAVMSHSMSPGATVTTIVILAIVQIFVHLVFFLHLNFSSEQRWNVTAFAFAALVVLIVIGGSLWIIHNMTDRMMPQMQQQLPGLTQQQG